MKEENINCTIEALILASPDPVPVGRLCEALEDVSPARVRQAINDLNNLYMGCGNSFRIREIAGGYQMYILADFETPIKNMLSRERRMRLTRAALETLAIIAYKQPVTKTEIEHIRGVSSDGVLHTLLEHNLILIAGRSEAPGRPLIYKTASEFLKFFGLNRLSDLPRMDEIEEMISQSRPDQDQVSLPFGLSETGDDGEGVEPVDEDVAVVPPLEVFDSADENDATDNPLRPDDADELEKVIGKSDFFGTDFNLDSLESSDDQITEAIDDYVHAPRVETMEELGIETTVPDDLARQRIDSDDDFSGAEEPVTARVLSNEDRSAVSSIDSEQEDWPLGENEDDLKP